MGEDSHPNGQGLKYFSRGKGLGVDLDGAGVELGFFEQFVDHLGQVFGTVYHFEGDFFLFLGEGTVEATVQEFGIADDCAERGAKLVADGLGVRF